MKPRFTLETFRQAQKNGPLDGRVCALLKFMKMLTVPERASIREALADTSIPAVAIHRVLRDLGYAYHVSSIHFHRRGECVHCRHAERIG